MWFLVYSSNTAQKKTMGEQCHGLLLFLLSHWVVSDSLWRHRLSMPGFPVLMSIELLVLSKHLILCSSLLLCLQSFPASRSFSNESAFPIKWPKYWSFSFSICHSNEYSGMISLGFHCLISLLSQELSRVFSSSTIWRHQFFGAQLSF